MATKAKAASGKDASGPKTAAGGEATAKPAGGRKPNALLFYVNGCNELLGVFELWQCIE